MKFRVKIMTYCSIWWEEFDVDTEDANQWAKYMARTFNVTRHPGEPRRTVLFVEVTDKYSLKQHRFDKQNLVTESDSTGLYDRMKCKRCGVTGRRYGLDSTVTFDGKFSAKRFWHCDTAMKALGIDRGI